MNMSQKFYWSKTKNEKLQRERSISFEDIVEAIDNWWLLDVIENPNRQKYPWEEMFIVAYKEYTYVVPFKIEQRYVILKTIYPSRKRHKFYS